MSNHGGSTATHQERFARFQRFYHNAGYRQTKRYLFNYKLRRLKIAPFVRGSRGTVLDVGCGIAPMAPAAAKAILADRSFAAMQAMRSDGNRAVALDIAILGIRTGSVGTIVCSEVLEHIADDRVALVELYRVLQPGGALVLTVPMHAHYWSIDDEFVGHHRRYQRSALMATLREIGFDVRRTVNIGSPLERCLTLATVLPFMFSASAPTRFSPSFLRLFDVLNSLLARILAVASHVSPPGLTSVELFYCGKPTSGGAA